MKFRHTSAKWEKDNEYLLLTVTRGRRVQVWWREGPIALRSNVLHGALRILSSVGPLCKWRTLAQKKKKTRQLFVIALHFYPKISLDRGFPSGNMFHNPESVWDNLIRLGGIRSRSFILNTESFYSKGTVQMTASDPAASIPLNLLGDEDFLLASSLSMQF